MAHQPSRPFESLEWYRDAARNNFRDDTARSGLVKWAIGFGMVHAHICVYATMIVVLLVVNLIRTPGEIWADKVIMAWTVLLLIHAVSVGVVWAINQWNADAPDEPLQMAPNRQWRQSSIFAWGPHTTQGSDPQEVDFRMRQPALPVPPTAPANEEVVPAAGWTGWNAEAATDEPDTSERASWKEASAAAWLDKPAPEAGGSNGVDQHP